jgi:FkbM family methyltransferase
VAQGVVRKVNQNVVVEAEGVTKRKGFKVDLGLHQEPATHLSARQTHGTMPNFPSVQGCPLRAVKQTDYSLRRTHGKGLKFDDVACTKYRDGHVNGGVQFSQYGEDKRVWGRFLSGTSPLAGIGRDGVFLEMGGYTGDVFSNTIMMEVCGEWRGLLLEAHPGNFAQMTRNRPCSINLQQAACATKSGGSIQVHMKGTEVNKDDSGTNASVPCRPLGDTLAEHNITHLHFFSLDVQGFELDVLATLDHRLTMSILLVEVEKMGEDKIATLRTFASRAGLVEAVDPPAKSLLFVTPALHAYDQLHVGQTEGW